MDSIVIKQPLSELLILSLLFVHTRYETPEPIILFKTRHVSFNETNYEKLNY